MSTPTPQTALPPNVIAPSSDDPELLFRAFLNEREATGRTATFIAVEVNRPKCLETLLAFRADPNIPNIKGITPLQLACERGFQTCIRVLIRNHASCSVSHGKNLVELIWESVRNLDERAELLSYLIANGAQCEINRLDALIGTLSPAYQGTFRKAVAEASLILQRSFVNPTDNPLNAKAAMSADARKIVSESGLDPLGMAITTEVGNRDDRSHNTANNPSSLDTLHQLAVRNAADQSNFP